MAGLFDKMFVGLNRSVAAVSEGSKNFIEKAKLNTQIQDMYKEKSNLITNIGTLVYNLQRDGLIDVEQCRGVCDRILDCDKKISALQEQMRIHESNDMKNILLKNEQSLDGTMCKCGYINRKGMSYCANCGSFIEIVCEDAGYGKEIEKEEFIDV